MQEAKGRRRGRERGRQPQIVTLEEPRDPTPYRLQDRDGADVFGAADLGAALAEHQRRRLARGFDNLAPEVLDVHRQ